MWLFGRKRLLLLVALVLSPMTQAETGLSLLPAPQSLAHPDEGMSALQRELEQLAAAGSYRDAVTPAQTLAEALASDPVLSTQALENLALVQLRAGDLAGGVEHLRQVLDRLRQSGNFRDPRLARPLFALGVAYYQLGDYAKAVEHIEQANFVTRTDRGLESLEQITHDELLLDGLIKTGRLEEALDRLEVSLNIQRQALQRGPELEQALARAARWYRTLNVAYQEGLLHEERLEILAESLGAQSLELVPVYYDLAASYSRRLYDDLEKLQGIKAAERNVSYSFVRSDQMRRTLSFESGNQMDERALLDAEWKAVRALKLALRIQEAQPEPDLAAIADTYVRLGDHYQLIGDSRKARRYYQRAYDLLNENGRSDYLAQIFGAPVPIYQRPLKLPSTDDPGVLSAYQGEAELVLDVNSRGQPRNIELLEIRPEQASVLEDKALRYSRDTIFRPRFTDKGTVETQQMRYIYHFQPSAAR